jgi:hypothetical protein
MFDTLFPELKRDLEGRAVFAEISRRRELPDEHSANRNYGLACLLAA